MLSSVENPISTKETLPMARRQEFLSHLGLSEMPPSLSPREERVVASAMREDKGLSENLVKANCRLQQVLDTNEKLELSRRVEIEREITGNKAQIQESQERVTAAIQKLFAGNLEELFIISESYRWLSHDCGIPWQDILSACEEGLVKGVQSWDPSLKSVLNPVLRNNVQRGIIQLLKEEVASFIHVEPQAASDYLQLKKEISNWVGKLSTTERSKIDSKDAAIFAYATSLFQELTKKLTYGFGRPPEEEELKAIKKYGFTAFSDSKATIKENIKGLSAKQQRGFLPRLYYLGRYADKPQKIRELFETFERRCRPYDTLDDFLGNVYGPSDVIIDDSSDIPDRRDFEREMRRYYLEQVLSTLNLQEELIIRLRYGLGGRGLTPEKIYLEAQSGRAVSFQSPGNIPIQVNNEIIRVGVEGIRKEEEVVRKTILEKVINGSPLLPLSPLHLYLLNGGEGIEEAFTLEQIGMLFGITREGIRGQQVGAERKLKHPSRRQRLRDLLAIYTRYP